MCLELTINMMMQKENLQHFPLKKINYIRKALEKAPLKCLTGYKVIRGLKEVPAEYVASNNEALGS